MLEEFDARFEALKSRLQQNPDSLMFARVADGLLKQGNVDEAIGVCEEGIRKHPYYVTGHMVLGKCYLQKKLFDLAEKEFKRVILFDPKYIAAHKLYGDLMREHGWDNTCEMSYRKILSIDPLDKNVRETLAALEQTKPQDQEVVTPEQPLISAYTPPVQKTHAEEIVHQEEEFLGQPELPETSAAESINLEEDLFAEVDAPVESPEPSAPKDVAAPADDEKEIKTILEDIFEDDDDSEADEFGMIEGLNIKISHRPPSSKSDEPPEQESPAVQGLEEVESENPDDVFGIFEEETIEFDAMKDLASEKDKSSEQLDTGELDFLSEPPLENDDAGNDVFLNLDDTPGEQAVEQTLQNQPEAPAPEPVAQPEPDPEESVTDFLPPTDFKQPEPIEEAFQEPAETNQPAPPMETPVEAVEEPGANGVDEDTDAISRDKIVTPTLGEIYAAQGQYAKAISVFELLLKKDQSNAGFQEKIVFLRQKLKESANV